MAEVAEPGKDAVKDVVDPWEVPKFETTDKPWAEKTGSEKAIFISLLASKVLLMLSVLYLFIISLGLMANSFRILGGKAAGRQFRDTDLFDNPLAGLVTGILVTVLVQSSSTSTSIIITMTAGDLIKLKNAIPMIMGANIGTSVTNTIVGLGSMGSKDEYRRAFAGATVHDCFNFLTVSLLLPIEYVTGMLRHIAGAIVDAFDLTNDEEKGSKTDFLKKIVKPVGSRVLAIDKKLITKIAEAETSDEVREYEEQSIIKHKQKDDNHLFLDTPMSDGLAGVLMVFVSLAFLCLCLIGLVKLLQSIFKGRIAIMMQKSMNLEFSFAPGLANYILILEGMVLTVLYQSSSVTTSTLTPLVGIGLVRIDKMFAFTVGANIGTCITGIMGAMVTDKRKTAMTVALSHVLFNVFGTLIWYPVPIIRSLPIEMAKILGNIAAEYRVFPFIYIAVVFVGIPVFLLLLSVASPWAVLFVGGPLILLFLATLLTLFLRFKMPTKLPMVLQSNPKWMPKVLHTADSESEQPSTADGIENQVGNADIGAGEWQFAPVAWGSAWFILLALLISVFNCKWADIKYPVFDGRDHVGIGAWQVCSNAYEDDMSWSVSYDQLSCNLTCAETEDMDQCSLSAAFSTTEGANDKYEDSWKACRETCSIQTWEAHCLNMNCGGSKHMEQCKNVTEAVYRPYQITYGPSNGALAWEAGERCKGVQDICDNSGSLKSAGDLGVSALVFHSIALTCLMVYCYTWKKRDMSKLLIASLALFWIAWTLLFVAWIIIAVISGKKATCLVEHISKTGAVWATGTFSDIVNGPSYTFGCVVGAWILYFVTIIAIILRIFGLKYQKTAEPDTPEPAISEVHVSM